MTAFAAYDNFIKGFVPEFSARSRPFFCEIVITGFNTDVEYEGVTYHVQTEDKGVETPLILTLVYHRGTILASKRSPYDDLLKTAFDGKILAERLQKQHKLICAAIRGGRLEDLKRMTMKDSAAKKAESVSTRKVAATKPPVKLQNQPQAIESAKPPLKIPPVSQKNPAADKPAASFNLPARTNERAGQKLAEKIDHVKLENSKPTISEVKNSNDGQLKIDKSAEIISKPTDVWEVSAVIEAEPLFEAFEIIEDEMILPDEAVAVVDFTAAESFHGKPPEIGFLNENDFKGGDRKTVSIIVWRGHRENGIADAQIMVKILGSNFRPMIFHAKTDSSGVATVHLQLPHFRAGRAAILVRALTGGEEIEMRRVITHG